MGTEFHKLDVSETLHVSADMRGHSKRLQEHLIAEHVIQTLPILVRFLFDGGNKKIMGLWIIIMSVYTPRLNSF